VLYGIAATVAFFKLKDRRFGRYCPALIWAYGMLIPLTVGLATSVCVAFVYTASNIDMSLCEGVLWGIGHTITHSLYAYSRMLAAL